VIWVGGASLAPALGGGRPARPACASRPCYGATETAAMVAAQPPQASLAGETGCGAALADVELRLCSGGGEGVNGSGAIEVRTSGLSPGWLRGGSAEPGAPACSPLLPEGWLAQRDAAGSMGTGLGDGRLRWGDPQWRLKRCFLNGWRKRLCLLSQRARQAGLAIAELLAAPVADPSGAAACGPLSEPRHRRPSRNHPGAFVPEIARPAATGAAPPALDRLPAARAQRSWGSGNEKRGKALLVQVPFEPAAWAAPSSEATGQHGERQTKRPRRKRFFSR